MVINTMGEEKKKESKFHFVSADEVSFIENSYYENDDSNESSLETVENSESIDNDSLEKIDDNKDLNEVTEEVDNIESFDGIPLEKVDDNKSDSQHHFIMKPYFSFEVRVGILIACVLILIAFSCYFFYKAMTNYSVENIYYDESSNVHYKVCLNGEAPVQPSCLGEDLQYDKNFVKTIDTSFEYVLKMATDVDYDMAYYVVGLTHIYNPGDSSKTIYKTEDILVNRRVLKDKGDSVKVNVDAEVDFSKFVSIVQDYKSHYSEDVKAAVDVILYLDKGKKSMDVASITIPLEEDVFSIGKFKISNVNQSLEIKSHLWNKSTTFYGIIASILLLLSMVFLYKMAHLVWKVTNNHNIFQTRLSQIFREYDRLIVIARDGYASNIPKKVIKVETFEELLKAREALEKPIIYSKVNSIKSEFIVEDDEKLYKYVLKESDL